MNDLNSLQVFLAVVEKASFTAAAKKLALPKATVSYKISHLEKSLGVRLLNRSTRAVTTTPDGAAYAEKCRPMVHNILEASDWISQGSKAPRGLLRVKAPTTYAQWAIAPALPQFLKSYPQVKISLIIADDFRTDIVQQGIDLVISVGPNADSDLVRFYLGHSTRKLYASKAYLKARPKISRVDDLRSHPCVICSHPRQSYQWTLTSKSRSVEVSVSGPLVSTDYVPLVEAARQGVGVALLPERICVTDVARGSLTPVLADWRWDSPEFNALIPSQKLVTPKLTAFIAFLKANPW